MYEVIFLWALALVYIIFAVIQDFKTREIANWLTFSLIIFALGFRLFYSMFSNDGFQFLFSGLIGLGIFFVLGNLLYYVKFFAGGDAKLMISLGTILPIFPILSSNIQSFFDFFLIFLIAGFLYILGSSIYFGIKNFKQFKKEFARQLKKNKRLMFAVLSLSIIMEILGFLQPIFFIVGILIFFTSNLFLYTKSVDEACMVKKVKTKDLQEGDWLYSNVKIGKENIKAKWEGLSKKEIRELRKKVLQTKIRQGIPFCLVFLISFVVFVLMNIFNIRLWNPFW